MKTFGKFCVILSLVFAFSTFESKAQCVQCLPGVSNPDALTCQPSSSGGRECGGGGHTCTVSGACSGGGGVPIPEGFGNRLDFSKECNSRKLGRVELDDSTIRAIGQEFPRLAIALGHMRKAGFLGSERAITTMLPIELDNTGYTRLLDNALKVSVFPNDRSEGLFTNFLDLPLPSRNHGLITYTSDIVFYDSEVQMIRIQPSNQMPLDPFFISIELPLVEINQFGTPSNSEKSWKVVGWNVRSN